MKLSVLLHNETVLQIQFPWSFDTLIVLSSLLLVFDTLIVLSSLLLVFDTLIVLSSLLLLFDTLIVLSSLLLVFDILIVLSSLLLVFDTSIVLSSLLLMLLEVYSPWGLALGLVDIQDCCLMKWLSPVLALNVCPLLVPWRDVSDVDPVAPELLPIDRNNV